MTRISWTIIHMRSKEIDKVDTNKTAINKKK